MRGRRFKARLICAQFAHLLPCEHNPESGLFDKSPLPEYLGDNFVPPSRNTAAQYGLQRQTWQQPAWVLYLQPVAENAYLDHLSRLVFAVCHRSGQLLSEIVSFLGGLVAVQKRLDESICLDAST